MSLWQKHRKQLGAKREKENYMEGSLRSGHRFRAWGPRGWLHNMSNEYFNLKIVMAYDTNCVWEGSCPSIYLEAIVPTYVG